MGFEIFDSQPGRFSPLARPAPYVSVMDNHRVQAWRLILPPGEVAPSMQQAAPGVRIVVRGGELVEGVQGKPDHKLNLKYGDFAWQNAGPVRTVRNAGTSTVELVEFELK
jgi:gentisate 1,2-dioxygenase